MVYLEQTRVFLFFILFFWVNEKLVILFILFWNRAKVHNTTRILEKGHLKLISKMSKVKIYPP